MVPETAAIRRPLLEGTCILIFLFLSFGGVEKRKEQKKEKGIRLRDVVWHLVELGGKIVPDMMWQKENFC